MFKIVWYTCTNKGLTAFFLQTFPLPFSCNPRQSLVHHLEEEDIEAFTNEVKTYDQMSRLDQWFTTILLRIKKQIPDEGELC